LDRRRGGAGSVLRGGHRSRLSRQGRHSRQAGSPNQRRLLPRCRGDRTSDQGAATVRRGSERDRRQNDRHSDFALGAGHSFTRCLGSALSRHGVVPDGGTLDEDAMATVTTEDLRNMKPLRVANHTVGTPAETLAMMEEDGYVYFRDVFDQGAVGRLRQRYMDVLVDWGVVDAGASEPVWNGADLSTFPVKIEPLHEARVWEEFVSDPAVDAFFTRLLGSPPFWLEITEYRITPPGATLPEDPFFGRHQDAFYNMGMECFTCWIPLMEIDERIGGLAVIPGLHKGDFFHDR